MEEKKDLKYRDFSKSGLEAQKNEGYTKAEKHETLFKEDLKDYKFDLDFQNFLTDFTDYAIESIAVLCGIWLIKYEIDFGLMKGMLVRSCYPYTRGLIWQFLIGSGYGSVATTDIGNKIVDYIVAQGLDQFGIRSGLITIN